MWTSVCPHSMGAGFQGQDSQENQAAVVLPLLLNPSYDTVMQQNKLKRLLILKCQITITQTQKLIQNSQVYQAQIL